MRPTRKYSTREQGNEGEALASSFLKEQGIEVLETQYRFGRGDIDIIAQEGDTLVFCEVKARRSDAFGEPEYAVTRTKQGRIRRIAEAYLFEHGIRERVCRFDVVAIRIMAPEVPGTAPATVIRHYRNAF